MSSPADGFDGREPAARVLSRLSHQLRNPLAVIVGYAELVGVRDDERTRKEAAAQITAAADLLGYAIEELVTLFALEAGAVEVRPEPVELEEALTTTLDQLRATVESHSFSVVRAPGAEWPVVAADEDQLGRILANAFMNAVRSSPEGGEVGVAVREEDGFAEIGVSDRGFGLTDEQLENVFDRFPSLPVPERADARVTGLELYKVRRLVELHGGSVSAESEPGRGTTVTFRIPLALEEGA